MPVKGAIPGNFIIDNLKLKNMAKAKSGVAKKSEAPTLTAGVTITIAKVRNITTGTDITIDASKLSSQQFFSADLTGTLTTAPTPLPASTDDIQVIWQQKKDQEPATTKFRAVGGTMSYDATTKLVTITGLKDVSKVKVGLSGVLDIGPAPTEQVPNPEVARISVRIGNINELNQWIMDFSAKSDAAPEGSYIKLKALLDWVKDKAPTDGDADLPQVGAEGSQSALDPSTFTIVFNEFHFNIDRKTFNIDISSKAGDSITFGAFTIRQVGFRVTNEPYNYNDTGDEEEEE